MGKMKKIEVKGMKRGVKARVAVMATQQKRKRKSALKASSPGLLGQLGFGVGSLLGGPAGGLTGLAAGKLISRITGFGDYKVNQNSISNGNSIPTFSNGGKGMRVMHREYLSDITGSVLFTNRSYSINPGQVTTFPWLSLIAADFEEYSMEGLVFEYRPTSGTAISSTSSALGVVVLATQYDATDPPFVNKQQMESYEYATSTVPFAGCIHPVECLRKLNVLGSQFVRTGLVPADADIRLYDIGNFQLSTSGMQSAYVIGELWVSYDVVFRKPRLPPTITLPSYARLRSSPALTVSTANLFGTSGTILNSDSTLSSVSTSGNDLQITRVGDYYVSITITPGVTGSARAISCLSCGGNMTFLTQRFMSGGFQVNVTDSAFQAATLNFYVRVTGEGTGVTNRVQFIIGASMTASNTEVVAVQLGSTLTNNLTRAQISSLHLENQDDNFTEVKMSDLRISV